MSRVQRLRRLMRPLKYLGTRVECPCCEGRFRRFMVIDAFVEKEQECPRCGAYARHRLVWLYLCRELAILSSPARLLHIAPSDPMYAERLEAQPNLDYVTADLDDPFAAEHWDITDIPHPAASFDAIVCSHVLEHVRDDRQAMRELYRVLKPTGWALVQSPVDWNRNTTYEEATDDPIAIYGQEDHVRFYGRDYELRLREAGFDVEVVPYVEGFSHTDRERFGLAPVETLQICRKPAREGERRLANR